MCLSNILTQMKFRWKKSTHVIFYDNQLQPLLLASGVTEHEAMDQHQAFVALSQVA